MAKDGPNWDGLLKWSLAHSDGTGSSRNLRYPSRMLSLYSTCVYVYNFLIYYYIRVYVHICLWFDWYCDACHMQDFFFFFFCANL